MPEATKTEAEAIAALATATIAPQYKQAPDTILPYLILKDGSTRSLEHLLERPLRKRATACFTELGSFINYVNDHKTERGTLLLGEVDEVTGMFGAIFDYHDRAVTPEESPNHIAGWGQHRATLQLVSTPEWKRWVAGSGKEWGQVEFAEFLDDNACDVTEPSGADLLEVAQTLEAKKSVAFRSGVRLQNGTHELNFVEQVDATAGRGGQLQVPEAFTLHLAPFVGCDSVEIKARLRYRIDGGKLTFVYRLYQPHAIVGAVWQTIREMIVEETGLMVHRGTATAWQG